MKTCIQRMPSCCAARSSIEHTEPWLWQYTVDAAAAARADAISPRGQKRPANPVGPMSTGDDSVWPNNVTD